MIKITGLAMYAAILSGAALSQQLPGACPAPSTGSFTGCYYSNTTLSGDPAIIRTDNQINFAWGDGSPDLALRPRDFSVRWRGNFNLSPGSYTFTIQTSDGARLYVDGNLVLDIWRDRAETLYKLSETLSGGVHLISMEHFEESGGGATVQLSWNNEAPAAQPPAQPPAISSFTASPVNSAPGQPVLLAWGTTGATSLSIDNGVGDVSGRTSVVVSPDRSTTYTLTASNGQSAATAQATVSISAPNTSDTQPPSVPSLTSADPKGPAEIDLAWIASTDNVGVIGYQILRNGSPAASVPGAVLSYADRALNPDTAYTYSIKAFDAAGNYSAASGSLQAKTPASPSPAGACPAPGSGAFTGCYYSNITLSGNPVLVRTDPAINFDWGNRSPDPSLAPLNFSIRWQGTFTLSAGNYTFVVTASDGVRFYIDGSLVLDQWRDRSASSYTVPQSLTQGSHLLVVEYYEHTGGAIAQVSWQAATPVTQGPVISSFSASPSNSAANQPVTLSWSVTGASAIAIDNGVGNVTGFSSTTVAPSQTTKYMLTASDGTTTATAGVTVNVTPTVTPPSGGGGGGGGGGGDTQPPTTPVLVSGIASAATEVDLTWMASSDNVGVALYTVFRNGYPAGSVNAPALTYADRDVYTGSTYTYTVKAYDAAGNYSAPSNALQVTTPAASGTSITWYGACWFNTTIFGISGNFQAVDFNLVTPAPVPIQGTLFDGADCKASGGDNMNDFNTLTGTSHMIRGFTHNPDAMPTSALYWIGDRTPDGRCPAGSLYCSGCVNYNSATPSCSALP